MKLGALVVALLPALWSQAPPPSPGAELVRAIREITLDPEQCYLVRDLAFARDDIKLYFNDGYLIFSTPVAGQRIAAIFSGTEDMADGELLLLPPDRGERQSLAKFAGTPNLDEHFHTAALTFTDDSAQALLAEIQVAGRGQNREAGEALARQWNPALASLTGSVAQRVALDLLTPGDAGGFFFASLETERLGAFDVVFDPLGDDQIVVGRVVQRAETFAYDVWSSFPSRSVRAGAGARRELPVTISSYRITASLDEELRLKAVTRATLTVGAEPVLAIQLAMSRAEQVTAVRLDGGPVEVLFQDSERSRALRGNENDVFLVLASQALAAGSTHEIELEHEGDVIEDRGNGVYAVSARSNWYPRTGMEFARYELEFRYPEQLTLLAPGEMVENRAEGGWRTTRWRTQAPIRIAGFNLGQYSHISKKTGGLTVDVYGNRGLDPALAPRPRTTIVRRQVQPLYRGAPPGQQTTAIVQTPPPPDPTARLEAVAEDMSQSLAFFAASFGPPALNTLTVSPIPGTTGLGFPGLIYLSTLSYLDEADRPQTAQDARQRTFFTDLMTPHEVAHQWWGNVVATESYQDAWIGEALAHYSALLWIEKKRGVGALEAELDNYRRDLLTQGADDGALEAYGPLTWGFRLEAAREPDTWRVITYEKGAWIFHMLRKRMGDERFLAMLAELRHRFEYKAISTHGLQQLAREFSTASDMDAFFGSWVRSTGIPAVRVRFSTSGRAPEVKVSGTVTYEESNRLRDFATEIPLEIQFPGGERRIEWVRSSDRAESFTLTLPRAPSHIGLATGMTLASER